VSAKKQDWLPALVQLPAETPKLSHLTKHRARTQQKRRPSRTHMKKSPNHEPIDHPQDGLSTTLLQSLELRSTIGINQKHSWFNGNDTDGNSRNECPESPRESPDLLPLGTKRLNQSTLPPIVFVGKTRGSIVANTTVSFP